MKILIIEDDNTIGLNLSEFLDAAGHETEWCVNGVDGLSRAITGGHDVLLLDLGLPRLDGLEVARAVRQARGESVLILMLTARDTLEDRLAGFDAGADDYLVKPFATAEVLARVTALGRRRTVESDAPTQNLVVQDVTLDPKTHTVRRGDRRITLNRLGFTLLKALMEKSPGVLTRKDCEEVLWDGFSPGGSVLRTHIYALRRALEVGDEPVILHTIRGVGYRLVGAEA